METSEWDAIVVGSGPGGLTTAACLGAAGKRVLVLERHDVAGGNTQVFRRHHGDDWFEFDVGVHYVGECGPNDFFFKVFEALGVGDRMSFAPLDPDGFDTLMFPDFTFRVPADWAEYERRMVVQFPDEREGIEQAMSILRTVGREGRLLFGEDRPTFDEWATRPLSDLFDHCELSARARAVLDHWSGLYAGGPGQSAVQMHASMIYHYMFGAYYPVGGGQMIGARLIQVIEACDGEVRTLSGVDRILIEDGAAVGVRLENGDEERAPVVVSNADHRRTLVDLVGADHLRPETVAWAEQARMTLGLVCTYVVVDRELEGPNTNYFVFPNYDIDSLYADLGAGRVGTETLMKVLERAQVYRDEVPNIVRLAARIPRRDHVHRIFIHLERMSAPEVFAEFGLRVCPFFNYFQPAVVLLQDGGIDVNAVLRVAADLVLGHGFGGEALAASVLDLARRRYVGRDVANQLARAAIDVDGPTYAGAAPALRQLAERLQRRLPELGEAGEIETLAIDYVDLFSRDKARARAARARATSRR